jgi:hypothetical protein
MRYVVFDYYWSAVWSRVLSPYPLRGTLMHYAIVGMVMSGLEVLIGQAVWPLAWCVFHCLPPI